MMMALQEALVNDWEDQIGMGSGTFFAYELVELCHLETKQCIGYVIVRTRYMHHTH